MTIQELKEVKRVHGKYFERSDVPAYIRQREEAEANDRFGNEWKQRKYEERN